MRQNSESKVVYPVEFDKVSGMSSRISSLPGRARSGLAPGKSLFVPKRVYAKLRDTSSTRRILHSKLQRFRLFRLFKIFSPKNGPRNLCSREGKKSLEILRFYIVSKLLTAYKYSPAILNFQNPHEDHRRR